MDDNDQAPHQQVLPNSSTPISSTPPNTSTPRSGQSSSSSKEQQQSSSRGKSDPAWGHCKQIMEGNKNVALKCIYCQKLYKGGGIHRIKMHLAAKKGDVSACMSVPAIVRNELKAHMESNATKKRKAQEHYDEDNSVNLDDGMDDYSDDIQHMCTPFQASTRESQSTQKSRLSQPSRSSTFNKEKPNDGLRSFFTSAGGQPSIRSVLQSKEIKDRVDLAISKWMIDACIPFNAVNSAYYQPMLDSIASFGAGYKGPGINQVRNYLLNKNVSLVRNYVEDHRKAWEFTGCTIMADGWTDRVRRTLINFLVYSPKGIVFVKSVDASDVSKTGDVLYNYLRDVVLYVGVENVVHVVTDNASNYVLAGKKLVKEFPTLYWSPCAAHCLNLMLQDIGKLPEVVEVVDKASKITKYIYNHCYALHLMRQHTKGREIIRPAQTRFATNFIALQSISTHKDALRAMVTSKEWTTSGYARETKAKKFVDDVLDSSFWKECALIVKLTEPLIRVLRLVDGDDKPTMGFLFAAMFAARDEMVSRFQRRKRIIEPYLKILDSRWDKQLHKDIHAAGFYLNPRYQYDNVEMTKHRTTISGLIDAIEKYTNGDEDLREKLSSEMKIFRNAEADFGRKSTINDRMKMMPDEWWLCYGSSAPNLQKLAIRVLSQTCSSSGCERNWSIFEHIHSKKRNRLEHQRLNDLVYAHSNLRLQRRNRLKNKCYDPINFEGFNETYDWVLEDEPSALTSEELETFRRELEACTIDDYPAQNDCDINIEDILDDEENDVEDLGIIPSPVGPAPVHDLGIESSTRYEAAGIPNDGLADQDTWYL